MNNLALSVALATAPASAYGELRERPRFWFPLVVLVVSTVAIVYWYYESGCEQCLRQDCAGDQRRCQRQPERQHVSAALRRSGSDDLFRPDGRFVILYLLVAASAICAAARLI